MNTKTVAGSRFGVGGRARHLASSRGPALPCTAPPVQPVRNAPNGQATTKPQRTLQRWSSTHYLVVVVAVGNETRGHSGDFEAIGRVRAWASHGRALRAARGRIPPRVKEQACVSIENTVRTLLDSTLLDSK